MSKIICFLFGHAYVPRILDFYVMKNGEYGTLTDECKRCGCAIKIDYEKKQHAAEYIVKKDKQMIDKKQCRELRDGKKTIEEKIDILKAAYQAEKQRADALAEQIKSIEKNADFLAEENQKLKAQIAELKEALKEIKGDE